MASVAQKTRLKTGRSKFSTVPIGSVAYGSMGTNTTMVAGTHYRAEIFINRRVTLSGISVLNGATVGTNKGIAYLYDSNGALVANSALAGATTAGANAFQTYAFTANVTVEPGQYFIVYQTDGTTDTIRTIAASTFIDAMTGSAVGTFATALNFTPPTTITADKGPIAYASQA
jgi:hypothetical protein